MDSKIKDALSFEEKRELLSLWNDLRPVLADVFETSEMSRLEDTLGRCVREAGCAHDDKGLPVAVMTLRTALAFAQMVDPDHNILTAILLHPLMKSGHLSHEEVVREWGDDVASLHGGLEEVARFMFVYTTDFAFGKTNSSGKVIPSWDDAHNGVVYDRKSR